MHYTVTYVVVNIKVLSFLHMLFRRMYVPMHSHLKTSIYLLGRSDIRMENLKTGWMGFHGNCKSEVRSLL